MSDRKTAKEEGSGHATAQGNYEKSVNEEKLFKYQAGCCSLPWELQGEEEGEVEGELQGEEEGEEAELRRAGSWPHSWGCAYLGLCAPEYAHTRRSGWRRFFSVPSQ